MKRLIPNGRSLSQAASLPDTSVRASRSARSGRPSRMVLALSLLISMMVRITACLPGSKGGRLARQQVSVREHARAVCLSSTSFHKQQQNGLVETSDGRLRDECLNEHLLRSLTAARTIFEASQVDYNIRPLTRALAGSSRTRLPLGPSRTRTRTDSDYEREQTGGKVTPETASMFTFIRQVRSSASLARLTA